MNLSHQFQVSSFQNPVTLISGNEMRAKAQLHLTREFTPAASHPSQ